MRTQENNPIEVYMSGFPEEIQALLADIRTQIKRAVPEAEETISYGIPTFKLHGINLVHFAAFKKHIGFYPTPTAILAFEKELADYRPAKGSVKFPFDRDIPIKLILKIVKFRVKEIKNKKQ